MTPKKQHLHRRSITLDGFLRHDGMIEVEAELKDTKSYDFSNHDRGAIKAGEPIHHMRVRIAIDDNFTVREAEATTLAGPYLACPQANAAFSNLIGIRIEKGWQRQLRGAIGGRQGCTHITELMGAVATTAMQTYYGIAASKRRANNASVGDGGEDNQAYASLINSCISYDEDGAVVARLFPKTAPKS